jgi:hypothetical protein
MLRRSEGPTGRVALAAAALSLAATLLLVASPVHALAGVVGELLLILPGLLLVRAAAGPAAGWLPVLAFGPFIGTALSSLVMLAAWVVGARGLWLFAAAPGVVMALVPFALRARDRWPFPEARRGDRLALAAALLTVPLLVAAPFAHVGQQIHVGKAYRAYFTADYVWRRAVVAEVAKGDVPPVNPFYTDDELHYYWLPHLPSAVAYRDTGWDLDELLLVHSVVIDAAFVVFLYGLARWLVPVPWAAAAGVISMLLATSYEGLFALVDYWLANAPLSLVRYLNIDAVVRWRLEGMPIDGLQRVLFYQPHHALGYALGMLGILAIATRRQRFDPMAMAVGGVLLGLSIVVSSFAGLMLMAAAALWEACSVVRWRDWWRGVVHAAAAALPLVLAAALVTALRYVDTGSPGSIISVAPNRLAFHRVWLVTPISFGPILLLSVLAAWILWKQRDRRAWLFAAVWVTLAFFYFFVDVRDHQDVYVGWRVGHIWFIASVALTAIVFAWLPGLRRRARIAWAAMLGLSIAAALPTTAIDVYNTQDIYNWGQGPGFYWTLILSPEEQEMLAWIKANTPPDAVFQVDALQRDVEGWAYVPAFAERRLGVGLPISMVPLLKYEQGSRRASWIFETGSPETAHHLSQRNGIQYLLLGSPERKRHPSAQARFDSAPEYFEPVFRNREGTIYRVK